MNDSVIAKAEGDGCLRLTLNRPDQANAVDDNLCNALLSQLQAAVEANIRVLIIDGNGKNFCGGFDLSGTDTLSEGDLLLRFVRIEQALQLLWTAPFVSIACVHGAVYGAGADILAASTYRIGAPGCRFRFPGYRFGIALGTRRLGSLVGEQKAKEILLGNTIVGDAEARNAGLLTHLEDRAGWEQRVHEIKTAMTGLSPTALVELLANVRQSDAGSADRDLANLVRSAARPGLLDRVATYRAAATKR